MSARWDDEFTESEQKLRRRPRKPQGRRRLADLTGDETGDIAARSFKNDAIYREGQVIPDQRAKRAMEGRRKGLDMLQEGWVMAERPPVAILAGQAERA